MVTELPSYNAIHVTACGTAVPTVGDTPRSGNILTQRGTVIRTRESGLYRTRIVAVHTGPV